MLDSLSSVSWTVPIGLIAAATFYYLGMPLLIRASQRMEAKPDFKALDFRRVKPAVAEFLTGQAEILLELGFDDATHWRIPNAVPDVTSYLIFLVNRKAGDEAMVTVIISDTTPSLQT